MQLKTVRRLARRWYIVRDCLYRLKDAGDAVYVLKQIAIMREQLDMARDLVNDALAAGEEVKP